MIRGIGLGLSLTLIAAGAILAWAITATSKDIDLVITGYIALGVGLFGLAIWLVNTSVNRWALSTGRFHPAPGAAGSLPPPH
jgi:hypothetical protein